MKILLVNLPNKYHDKKRKEVFFPIGLGYIAGALLEENHEVEILDIYALDLSDEDVAIAIAGMKCDVVGISAMSTQYKYVKWLSALIKKLHPEVKIILGWVLATYNAEIALQNTDVDICVIGEGENTIKELLANLDCLSSVKGIAYKKDGKFRRNQGREYIKNLDALPKIPYELFPMAAYINSLSRCVSGGMERTINISCGRGCPYECTFCSKSLSGVRLRPIKDIVNEIKFFKSAYGIERIFFCDELLVASKSRIIEICEHVAPLKIKWSCQGRINLVGEEILRTMKEAGCTAIGYGVESASQVILDAMNKKIKIEKAEEVIKLTKKVGLIPVLQFIFGYPGENMTTIKQAIEFFKRIDEPSASFTPITPLPGSKLWEDCIAKKVIQDEAAFLEKLEGGYMPDAPTLVNFTSFETKELDRLRIWAEKQIRLNYIKRHPVLTFRRIKDKIINEGFVCTLKRMYNFIERNAACTKKH